MQANKDYSSEKIMDVIGQLENLITSGWTEQQIAGLARLRACYNSGYDFPEPAEIEFPDTAERDRLAFAHWLYCSGRLSS